MTASQETAKLMAPPVRRRLFSRNRPPLPAEFHGAWLGAGAGVTVGAFVVGLIQTWITHKALPGFLVTGIDGLCSAGLAALGTWLAHVTRGIL